MVTINESIATFLSKYEEVHSLNTASTYKYGLGHFIKHLAKLGVNPERKTSQLKIGHFITFVSYMARSELKRTSWLTYVAGAVAYRKYLSDSDLLDVTEKDLHHLQQAVHPIQKLHKRLPQVPSEDTLARMKAWAGEKGTEIIRLRNVALIEFLSSTGCRVDEVHKLTVGDVDFAQQRVRVIGKGDKERLVFPSQTACDRLQAYFNARNAKPDEPMFIGHVIGKNMGTLTTRGMWGVVNKISIGSGVGHIHPHEFRHYFATVMLDKTSDLALVQDLMGHSSPATTRIYADVAVSKRQAACRSVFNS
jgi:site-specific recombinase XerD